MKLTSRKILSKIKLDKGTDTFELDGQTSYTFPQDGRWDTWTSGERWLSNKRRNSLARAKNGNIAKTKQTIRLYHWNIGNGWWDSKKLMKLRH